MALKTRGQDEYGDSQADIREAISRFSEESYPAAHFADAVCECGGRIFTILLDETAGAAARTCVACDQQEAIADGEEYLDDAELGECACRCGKMAFEVTAGVALYDGSEDVRWFYLGLRCPACGLAAVYGDWKCEAGGYRELLEGV